MTELLNHNACQGLGTVFTRETSAARFSTDVSQGKVDRDQQEPGNKARKDRLRRTTRPS